MKATAIANANIALSKYWGKRNKEIMLPNNGSISMTTDGMYAHTTVEFSDKFERDIVIIDDKEFEPGTEEYDDYVGVFLKVLREKFPEKTKNMKVKIVSKNNFPTAAGLASSAAGFAALAMACSGALELGLDEKELSMLARRGSGSATRSIHAGFVEWTRGEKEDGSDCFGEQIAPPEHWPEFRMICVITSKKQKKIKSRAGMKQTVETCPFYPVWLDTVNEDLDIIRKGIKDKDFTAVGSQAEYNCLKMHATMITTKPSIIYWGPTTMNILHSVMDWRDEGLECYFTMDAGPQVKILCLEKDVNEITDRLKEIDDIKDVKITKPGQGAKLNDEHLF